MDSTPQSGDATRSPLNIAEYRYRAMVGVGGIGWGMFFGIDGDRTLGREESRGGRFLDRQDYCKLHIISHYVQTLLGGDFATFPVGKVGDEDVGRRLVAEMKDAGMRVDYVRRVPGARTLFSLCLVYPDGSGGNLTTADSACSAVDAEFVAGAEAEFDRFETRGIALAVPEVPMEARVKLLELGTQHRFFRAAAFTSEEIPSAVESGLLGEVDLLAMNLDEAAAAGGVPANGEPVSIVDAAAEAIGRANSGIRVSVTAGAKGSWSWEGGSLVHVPAYKASVVSAAGAGDAHFAGILVGLAGGLKLAEAQELGALVAAMSVTSPHTIHPGIDRASLRRFAEESGAPICESVRRLLEDSG